MHCSQPNTNRLNHLVTEKRLQRRKQKLHTLVCRTQLTLVTAAYLHCPIYTPGRPTWWGLCSCWSRADHVNSETWPPHLISRKWWRRIRRGEGNQISLVRFKIIQVCQGERIRVEGRNVEFCLLQHPGHYGLLINIEHPWMPLLTSTFIFTKWAYHQLSD